MGMLQDIWKNKNVNSAFERFCDEGSLALREWLDDHDRRHRERVKAGKEKPELETMLLSTLMGFKEISNQGAQPVERIRAATVPLLGQPNISNLLGPKANEIFSSLSAESPKSSGDDLGERVLKMLGNHEKRKALYELRDDEAQAMIDYMNAMVLSPPVAQSASLRKQVLITLYRLCSAARLQPQCYVLKDLTFGSLEDSGGFCDIWKGTHNGQTLCLKVVRLYQKQDINAILKAYAKEAILWGQLHHPNIVPFYGIFHTDAARKQLCLVSPWMQNGNLVSYLKHNTTVPRLPLVYDTAAGLEYLHEQGIIHGDLKGVNILVDDSGKACITDFGLSAVRIDKTLSYTVGTSTATGCSYRWLAPELLDECRPNQASDVWAFGCVCLEVLTGQLPYNDCFNDAQIIRRLIVGDLPGQLEDTPSGYGVDHEVLELVGRCWSPDPQARPECREIVKGLGTKASLADRINPISDEEQYKSIRFQDEMRGGEEGMINLEIIEAILHDLCGTVCCP